jgi:DNA-3-methyladenine glycosylase II
MWFDLPASTPDWTKAVRHLRKVDPVMRKVIDRVGPCTLVPRADPYTALCQAIFSQQVSTAAAASMFGKFKKLFLGGRPTPGRVLKVLDGDPEVVRSCGLSRQKQVYIRDLAERFHRRSIPVQRFPEMSDEEVIEALIPVKGVGRWTAEMFLIFVMNRPDLLPVDDLGVRKGVQVFYGLDEMPSKLETAMVGEAWRPWRSVATWYLWRGLGLEVMEKKKQAKADG